MQAPRDLDQYLDLVDQAIFEVGEMLVCAGDEDEVDPWFTRMRPELERLAASLRALHSEIAGGRHRFADGQDLDFMSVVRPLKYRLPITPLLDAINRFHKTGIG